MKLRYIIVICILCALTATTYVYLYNSHLTESVTFNHVSVSESEIVKKDNLSQKDTINILVIDGGGIRGLIPLYVLQHIEQEVGQPINELFDVFSGVSTGAVIASGLNIPSDQLANQYSDYDSKVDLLIDLYKSQSDYLFSSPWHHKILSASGFFSPKFLGERLHKVLGKHYTEELKFTDLDNYVIIPSLDIHTGQVHLFKNRGKEVTELPTNSLYQLVTAAVSAETLFPPVDFMSSNKDIRHRYFADAGISANNPASLALLDIIKKFPNKKYYVLILGAGTSPLTSTETSYGKLKNWGSIQWIPDVITNVQRSMDQQQIYTMEIAKLLSASGTVEYNYLNIEISDPSVGPFEYNNIDSLEIHSDRLIKENRDAVQQVIQHLKQEC
ncbi:patatin-like phospholipase family protein [Microbulbifer sp. OS29]|uniref:Patatin-like phospholipase family protein n=1 Tax=Microbulbifer okhotskensis TaxID=2926617 RepID=A0A9X2J860_9GAMM|nr:patatin-like phospholipase family protein [Microbulbifer okhotskensis]MCO1336525.1 patatin-like phospholipase family protein [Microbulbifer okhotskensis]